MKPVFFRSSGVLKAYMMRRKMRVDRSAYSMSRVAVKAINVKDANRNAALSKSTPSFSGILNALPEKRPWYMIKSENTIGWVRRNVSAELVTGSNNLEIFAILIT
jgi:hypothetical protein